MNAEEIRDRDGMPQRDGTNRFPPSRGSGDESPTFVNVALSEALSAWRVSQKARKSRGKIDENERRNEATCQLNGQIGPLDLVRLGIAWRIVCKLLDSSSRSFDPLLAVKS